MRNKEEEATEKKKMKWKKEEEEWRPATWICRFLTHISARFSLFRQIRANSARIKKKKKRDSPQMRMQLRQWPHGAPMRVWCRCGAPEATPVLASNHRAAPWWVLDSRPLMHPYFWQLGNFSFSVVPPLHGSCQNQILDPLWYTILFSIMIYFQRLTPYGPVATSKHHPSKRQYLISLPFLHSAYSFYALHQNHFPRCAEFKTRYFLTPKPP